MLSLITAAALAQALMRQGLPVLYPFIQDEFGLSRAQVGLITSALGVGFTAVALLAGWLTDALGVKRMITIALLSTSAFILAFPLAHSFMLILALAVVIAVVSSPVHPSTTRAVIDWFPGRIRALAMSFKQSGIPIAGTLTAAVLPALAVAAGWRMAAAANGLLVLAVALTFIWLYRDAPPGDMPAHKFSLGTLKNIFRNRGLVTTLFWGATFMGLQFIVLTYFMLFVIEELGLSAIMAGGLLAIAQVTSIASRVLWGAASDFVFRRRRIAVLAIIGLITAAWMLGASLISGAAPGVLLYLLAGVVGISTISFHGVFNTLVGEQAEPGQVGVTIGAATTINNASMMLAPPLFGLLVDVTGSYSIGWRVTAAVALALTLALLAFAREPQRR